VGGFIDLYQTCALRPNAGAIVTLAVFNLCFAFRGGMSITVRKAHRYRYRFRASLFVNARDLFR